MKSTMEILTKLQENSQKNHDEIFTRLYRYLLRPDIYFIAYQHLYSNKGAGTKGVNDDTADGFSEQYVTAIIEALRTGSYEPKPVRRTYIQKKNGKLRPHFYRTGKDVTRTHEKLSGGKINHTFCVFRKIETGALLSGKRIFRNDFYTPVQIRRTHDAVLSS